MAIVPKTEEFINKNKLIHHADHILAGVSGGPDSVALVYVLNELKYALGFHLSIAHFDHRLRAESGADARFVQKLAALLNVPFVLGKSHSSRQKNKASVENMAREERYAFLAKTAKKIKADAVAVAHTQDDLAETVLMRVIRGSGLRGMRAILPQRIIFQTQIIRPFLNITKPEVLAFLKARRISFRLDATNKKEDFLRNKIRLKLLPFLEKEYNPKLRDGLCHISLNAALDYDYLEQQASKAFDKAVFLSKAGGAVSLRAGVLKKLHPSLMRMVIRKGVDRIHGSVMEISTRHIQEIEDLLHNRPDNTVVNLPRGIFIRLKRNKLTIAKS